MSAFGFSREDVGDVHFDERELHRREGVSEGQTGVRVRSRVDHRSVGVAAKGLDRADELALAVMLSAANVHAELPADSRQPLLDFGERRRTVERRISHSKKVEVGPIEHRDPHFFLSPSSQTLNCSMSSPEPLGGVASFDVACVGSEDGARAGGCAAAFSEKN